MERNWNPGRGSRPGSAGCGAGATPWWRERLGEVGLREALATLRLGSLRAIIRQHGLDPHGALAAVNDAARLRAHILAKTGAHGD